MDEGMALAAAALGLLAWGLPKAHRRLQLSRAKHRSLAGHARIAKRIAALIPGYALFEYLGLSGSLGALIMGMVLAGHPGADQLSRSLFTLKELLLVAFFVNIGFAGLPTGPTLAGGLALLPGFNDVHSHSVWFGTTLMEADLSQVTSLEDIYRAIEAQAAQTGADDWVVAAGYNPVLLDGETLYEAVGRGHHHHFSCTRCGRVFTLHTCPVTLPSSAVYPGGFVVEAHEVTLYGQCPECAARKTGAH